MGQAACSPPCAIEVAKAKKAKEVRTYQRKGREKLKTLSQLCAETQKIVNRYIRLRDEGLLCISCYERPVTDAGHLFHAGSKYRTSRLRFDHRVLNGQCAHCNRYKGGGNMQGYESGYLERYGQAAWDEVQELKLQADRGELEPLTDDEVREIARTHRRLIREMLKVE